MTKLVKNFSKRIYQHNVKGEIIQILPGEQKEISDEIASIWLKTKEIQLVADKTEMEAKDKEIEKLKKELKKAKGKKKAEEPAEKEEPIAE